MERDPRAYLWDVDEGASTIADFVSGNALDDYLSNRMLRSAVERQLTIIGEALNQLSKRFPQVAQRIPELPRVVGLRNILIHGYASVHHATVWSVIQHDLPHLKQRASELLSELDASAD